VSSVRFAWVGFHAEGLPALDALLAAGAPIHVVMTLRPDLAARRAGAADYTPVCAKHDVPLRHIAGINEPDAASILTDLAPDAVFVIGWHQIVRPPVLRLARIGMVGAHASLLPHNRGSAPINWAIIRGECETGNSLIWLAEDVDAGEVIDQRAFPITLYDTCATLYAQVAVTNRDMLLALWPRIATGERPGRPQPSTHEPVLPRRRPADGRIEWQQSAKALYDFVRALTRPYPGAFSWMDGHRWRIWQAALPPTAGAVFDGEAGEVLGPVVSPVEDACGQLVACGDGGALMLLELEDDTGVVLRGRALSEQRWIARRWSDE
jgi:methionyl-tRNA formyltransferase